MKTKIWNGVGFQPLPEAFAAPEPPTLEVLKAAKIRALNNAFHLRLKDGHIIEGVAYSLTEEGRLGYVQRGLLYLYAGKQNGNSVGAKDKNENVVAMNYTQFKNRMVQVGVAYETLVQTLANRKTAVQSAVDESELNAISEVFA